MLPDTGLIGQKQVEDGQILRNPLFGISSGEYCTLIMFIKDILRKGVHKIQKASSNETALSQIDKMDDNTLSKLLLQAWKDNVSIPDEDSDTVDDAVAEQ